MFKKILIVCTTLISIAALLLIIALINANSLITSYQADLEKLASDALGNKVVLSDIQAKVFPQTKIKIGALRVLLPEGAKEQGLSLQNFYLNLKLLPLLAKRLEITRLSVENPSLTIVKDKSGIRIVGLPAPQAKQPVQDKKTKPEAPTTHLQKSAKASGLKLALNDIEIIGANITFKDEIEQKEYRAKNIDFATKVSLEGQDITVSNLNLAGNLLDKLDVQLKTPLLSFKSNILKTEEIAVSALGNTVKMGITFDAVATSGQASLLSDGIDLASFETLAPDLKKLSLKGNLRPLLSASILSPTAWSTKGNIGLAGVGLISGLLTISNLNGDLGVSASAAMQSISSGNISFDLNGKPVQAGFSASLKDNQIGLNNIELKLFSGRINSDFSLLLDQAKPFSVALDISGIRVEEALSTLNPTSEPKISGNLVSLKADVSGKLSDNIPNTIIGKSSIQLKDGSLKGMNLAGAILKEVKDIPLISGALYAAVPPADRPLLDSPDTPINNLTGNLSISQGSIRTSDLKMESSIFSLEAQGSVGFDSSLDLNATIYFSKDFSTRLCLSNSNLKNLLDKDSRLVFPLTLKGKAPHLLIVPNITKLLETGAGRALQKKAGETLDKVLKGKGRKLGKILGF